MLPMTDKRKTVPGYRVYRPFPQAVFLALNQCIACVLCVVALPVFVAIAVILLTVEGRPLFYVSNRLGRNKKKYGMYKFRTLPQGSDKELSRSYFRYSYQQVSFLSKFLRESRLDELPQLLNVLKGEMNIVGPRPVRPEIYESICRQIVNYDFRFNVRPGMIGFAQLFTPYSAPKKIRSLIDNTLIKRKKSLRKDALMVIYTILVLGKKAHFMGYGLLRTLFFSKILGRYEDKRGLDRIKHGSVLCLGFSSADFAQEMFREKLFDINELCFCIDCLHHLDDQEYYFKMKIKTDTRKKTARVKGRLFRVDTKKQGTGYRYIFEYEALNAFHQYLIDQYFLEKSICRL